MSVSTSAMIATGMLIQKIARQVHCGQLAAERSGRSRSGRR